MELKLKIGYAELLELIKQLPASQIFQLKSELEEKPLPTRKTVEKTAFRTLLLKGPVMSEEQYQQFLQTRAWMSQWRTNYSA
ncbi:MAG: hypothetical protein Q7T20_13060 [Saprospiraceae bacterium]|nr:hypothetical protein [Saprospiraceae bacterium]